MEELTYEWVVQAWLPFLDQGQLKTSMVRSFRVNWDWAPNIQVVVFFPIAKSQLSLGKSVFGELGKFSGATVFAAQEYDAWQTQYRIWAACS